MEVSSRIGEYSLVRINSDKMISMMNGLSPEQMIGRDDYGSIPGTATVNVKDMPFDQMVTPVAHTCVAGVAENLNGEVVFFHHIRDDFKHSKTRLKNKVGSIKNGLYGTKLETFDSG